MCPFPSPHPLLAKRRGRDALPAPQPVPGLAVGVSRVVARAARDKGCLSDARADLGRRFPDAWPASDSRPGGPQRPTSAPRTPPPAAPAGPPRGVGSGGGRGAAPSQLSLLSPEGMSADFLKPDPGRPPARRPSPGPAPSGMAGGARGLTWGARVKSSFRSRPRRPLAAERGGGWEAIKPSHSSLAT